mmetsp:Transcript_41720/g.65144  ORF Transcript_41720/g.65144 Transcript_41720/m.65144 type:complete len:187 (-) Transcript_41720:118-678(-)|eukprot:CAMPEP_0184307220 /NCGR_PEP_ID=MMETSP1049-20130417/16012_1 /TAXON_ID=77928 /ORGANISM="Proteomonas sulcata, Strain CCMP704" /LENGTH=186 /DNA_ID=CAMNT_0026619665 /DNA_START=47 /DNA_END=607 /DNA_ORIENTATION=+
MSDASSSLLGGRKKGYRDHYVNSTAFTVAMATAAVVIVGGAVCLSSMMVAKSAKEAQELLPPTPQSLHSKAYGATHAGVGFANYVVGNAVSNFWQSEMGKKNTKAKISDPFASFLLKPKKAKKARGSRGRDDEAPEQQADDAQPVDREHHRIGSAKATDAAIQHAQDVAMTHVKKARGSRTLGSAK